ncbi:hypothetical protein KGM_204079 [Danaus plexippus plexippus]|uniref:Uncharacterized protein n=1 Tax=Danaus plexippus plexippus TaxID=278856 RepID=A0A212F336_DANPL|nr:hypothetical protein KGM_204079 [Danaus plexippus plexippus]
MWVARPAETNKNATMAGASTLHPRRTSPRAHQSPPYARGSKVRGPVTRLAQNKKVKPKMKLKTNGKVHSERDLVAIDIELDSAQTRPGNKRRREKIKAHS